LFHGEEKQKDNGKFWKKEKGGERKQRGLCLVQCGVEFLVDEENRVRCVVDEGLLERDTSMMSRIVTVPYEVVGSASIHAHANMATWK